MKNFSYPYKTVVLILSIIILITPTFVFVVLPFKQTGYDSTNIFKVILLVSTLLANLGFIYSTLGYHFQVLRGDELKLKIHLESLNIAFTTTLVFFFILIFIFVNFAPQMLNYILAFLVIIGIVAYVLGIEFIKEKYQ